MSYNGSGTFVINSAGQPVVTGTVISSTAFNALTADLATGLSTAITKDGQTTTTARIVFAQGVSSTLVTDATSATTGSIITAGGISTQKALWVGTTATIAGATTMAGITATSLALGGATLGTNALAVTGTTLLNSALTYGGVTLSNAVTGTGNMVLSAAPTLTGTLSITGTSGTPKQFLSVTGTGIAFTYSDITNTGGTYRFGVEDSGGGSMGTGTSSYSAVAGTNGATPYQIITNGILRTTVDSNGNLFVNETGSWGGSAKLESKATVANGQAVSGWATGSGGASFIGRIDNTNGYYALFYYSSATTLTGSITTNGTTTAYNVTSDYRLKENVQPMTGGLTTVLALKPVTYDWISNGSAGEGFIAHEIQAVIPDAVHGEKDAVDDKGEIKPQGVDFSKIVPHLVAAIQELTTRLAALENK